MRVSNPLPPEGINTSATHPLKEFLFLTGSLLAIGLFAILALTLFADRLAVVIPFEAEVRLAATTQPPTASEDGAIQQYLQGLADIIASRQGMPDNMPITVHYIRSPAVNALASFGGHVVMFEGLYKRLHSEDAVAMVLAHEVAHIRYRHPIRAMGRGVVLALALSMLDMSAGVSVAGDIMGGAGVLTALSFSREQERQADLAALHSLHALYGHLAGAGELFAAFPKQGETGPFKEFFHSHPLTEHRISDLREFARGQGWILTGEITAIPESARPG